MGATRVKSVASFAGASALVAAIGFCLVHSPGPSADNVAGGSGDSATGTAYTSPTVPAMSVNPTAMSVGSTVTEAAPATTLATAVASPTLKASAAAGCVNNGQCP
jgi:hypothetical protein